MKYQVFEPGCAPKIFFEDEDKRIHRGSVCFPGVPKNMIMPGSVGANAAEIIRRGGEAHIACIVVYKDTFGTVRRTISHIACTQVESGQRVSFSPYRRHNKAS